MTFEASIFDLATLMQDLLPSDHLDLEKNENVKGFFQLMNLFGQIKYLDDSYDVIAVETIFRLFARDVTIAEHYVAQLTNLGITKMYHPQFSVNMQMITNLIFFIQSILRRVDINNLKFFASWRFLLFKLMSKCWQMIDQGIYQKNLQNYQSMMLQCHGVDFSLELEIFYEIVLQLANKQRFLWCSCTASTSDVRDKISGLTQMLEEKSRRNKTKKAFLPSIATSNEKNDVQVLNSDSNDVLPSINCYVSDIFFDGLEIRYEKNDIIDSNSDPIDVLLSSNCRVSDAVFDGLEIRYEKKNISVQNDNSILLREERKRILSNSDEIVLVKRNFASRIRKEKKQSLLNQTQKIEEKNQQKFPYWRVNNSENSNYIVDQVEKIPSGSENPAQKIAPSQFKNLKDNEKKSSPLKEQHVPEKKARKQKYNQIWLRK